MKAIVLCGGYGTRLGRLCADSPKPLLDLGQDRTIVEHIMASLASAGIQDVFVNLHYHAESLRSR